MILYLLFLFIFGAIIGSFLNVVILRLGTGKSFVSGRSKCFSCGHLLSSFDLVPMVSFLFLGGKCRYCKSKISKQYIFVEFLTACLFALAGYFVGMPASTLAGILFLLSLIIISFYIVIAIYDMRHKIIPDVLSYSVALIALAYSAIVIFSGGDTYARFAAGFLVALPFFFLWLVSRGTWMGLGDPKLALSVGWWLGVSAGYSALCLSVWTGAVWGIAILIIERCKTKSFHLGAHEMPFGPFIILGAILAYLFGITLATLLNAV